MRTLLPISYNGDDNRAAGFRVRVRVRYRGVDHGRHRNALSSTRTLRAAETGLRLHRGTAATQEVDWRRPDPDGRDRSAARRRTLRIARWGGLRVHAAQAATCFHR